MRTIFLKSFNGRYKGPDKDRQTLSADHEQLEESDFLVMEIDENLELNVNPPVAFKAANKKYVRVLGDEGNVLKADGQQKERFIFVDKGSGKCALKASNGKYVSAETDGKFILRANRDSIGP